MHEHNKLKSINEYKHNCRNRKTLLTDSLLSFFTNFKLLYSCLIVRQKHGSANHKFAFAYIFNILHHILHVRTCVRSTCIC